MCIGERTKVMGCNFLIAQPEKAAARDEDEDDNVQCIEDYYNSMFYGQEIKEPNVHLCSDWVEDDGNESIGSTESQDMAERTIYWESQQALLQEILERYSLTGSKLRQKISRLVDVARETNICNCSKPKFDGCALCLRRRVVKLLSNNGFNATLCTSKWKSTPKFPGGRHEYIEVIVSTQGRKKQISYLIELAFRDEFRMAKASDEYQKLIDQLPKIYIGKPDHLHAIVRIVCNAAKRSTSETKIYMGPWRKRSFMQMKWSACQDKLHLEKSSNKFKFISPAQTHTDTSLQFSSATAVEVA